MKLFSTIEIFNKIQKYQKIIIVLIILMNVVINIKGIGIPKIYLQIVNLGSIYIVSYLFSLSNQDILDKLYLTVIFGASILIWVILNHFFSLSPTRILILAFAWVLMVFNIRLLSKKWLEKILERSIWFLNFMVNQDMLLVFYGLIGSFYILFITNNLNFVLSIIYVFFMVVALNTFTIVNSGGSIGVRYSGTMPYDEFMKLFGRVPTEKTPHVLLGSAAITCLGLLAYNYMNIQLEHAKIQYEHVKNQHELDRIKEINQLERDKEFLQELNRYINELKSDKEKTFLKYENAKDNEYKKMLSKDISFINQRITQFDCLKADLLKNAIPSAEIVESSTIQTSITKI